MEPTNVEEQVATVEEQIANVEEQVANVETVALTEMVEEPVTAAPPETQTNNVVEEPLETTVELGPVEHVDALDKEPLPNAGAEGCSSAGT